MAGYVACVFGASTELGRLVVRELLRRDEVDIVYALTVRTIKQTLNLSPRYLSKLEERVNPLDRMLTPLRDIENIDLAFCCMGSSKAAFSKLGSLQFHRLNLQLPLLFVQAMYASVVLRIEILGHAKADSASRSDFARVKGEFEDAVRRLYRKTEPDGPGVALYKVPLLLTNERCQDGERGGNLSKNELFRQRAAVRLGLGAGSAVHVRDIAKAMRTNAILQASSLGRGTGVDLLVAVKNFRLTVLDGPKIVEIAKKTREYENAQHDIEREHRLGAYRMATASGDDALGMFGGAAGTGVNAVGRAPQRRGVHTGSTAVGGLAGVRAPQRIEVLPEHAAAGAHVGNAAPPRRQRRTPLDPLDDRQAFYEGDDADNPFASDSRLALSNPHLAAQMEGAEGNTLPVHHPVRDAGRLGSIELLRRQQGKNLLTTQRENFYAPSARPFGRHVGRRDRPQAPIYDAGYGQPGAGHPPSRSGRASRDSVGSSPYGSVPSGPRRSSGARPPRRSSGATRPRRESESTRPSFTSIRRSFSTSRSRRQSAGQAPGRRFSSAGTPKQSGGWFSGLMERFIAPKSQRAEAKTPRRRPGDERALGLVDI